MYRLQALSNTSEQREAKQQSSTFTEQRMLLVACVYFADMSQTLVGIDSWQRETVALRMREVDQSRHELGPLVESG